jgi:putative hemolysin
MNTLESLDSTPEDLALIDSPAYPLFSDSIPRKELNDGRYNVRFARTREELDAVLRLRFEVFNLELGEGLDSSFLIGRDVDEYDAACHHLIVEESETNRIAGTYRMQTGDMAAAGRGFYSATEFDLSHFPSGVLKNSVELGRACVARDHRNAQVLFLLWKGLAQYVAHNQKRYLFGCCSLTSQDSSEGLQVMELLERDGNLHANLCAPPRPGFECKVDDDYIGDGDRKVSVPKLFRIYMHYGAKVCGAPAIDRQFKTIDFLVLFDVFEMGSQTRKMFFGA